MLASEVRGHDASSDFWCVGFLLAMGCVILWLTDSCCCPPAGSTTSSSTALQNEGELGDDDVFTVRTAAVVSVTAAAAPSMPGLHHCAPLNFKQLQPPSKARAEGWVGVQGGWWGGGEGVTWPAPIPHRSCWNHGSFFFSSSVLSSQWFYTSSNQADVVYSHSEF